MADDGKFFDLEIITPDRVFWTGKASMLELNTTEGEVGIYKRHIPMTMIIEPGIVKIHEEDGIREAAVHAGFIEILPDRISMMAEVAADLTAYTGGDCLLTDDKAPVEVLGMRVLDELIAGELDYYRENFSLQEILGMLG